MFESVIVSPRVRAGRLRAIGIAAAAHGALALGIVTAQVFAVEDLAAPELRPVLYTIAPIPVDLGGGGGPRPVRHDPPKQDKARATPKPPVVQPPERVAELADLRTPVEDPRPAIADPSGPGDADARGPGGPGIGDGPGPGSGPGSGGSEVGLPPAKDVYLPGEVDAIPAATADCRDPVYPQLARNMHLQGDVRFQAIVGTDGRVREIVKVAGNDILARAAADALERCRFTPARLRGNAVQARLEWTVRFRLQ